MEPVTFSVNINGIPVEAAYTQENIREIFVPLLQRLTKLQKEKKKRVLAIFAAPPGAGKTTLLRFLRKLSMETEGVSPVTVIGMDGFHRYQEYLTTHTMMRDGEEILMVKVKGAPETFDLPLLTARIERLAAGEHCGWPDYDRMKHNPVEDATVVDGDIVLLEGNYLLLKDPGWCELKKFADLTVKITADEDMLRERLTDRKEKTGVTLAQAKEFVEYSDMANVRKCLYDSVSADVELKVQSDGSYLQL